MVVQSRQEVISKSESGDPDYNYNKLTWLEPAIQSEILNDCFSLESPHFIAKPSPSMTVKEKQNVILPCKAAGFPPPVIKWYKDGQAIKEDRKQFKKRNLEIKSILYEDHGIYTCTAENHLGKVQLSVNVTVQV